MSLKTSLRTHSCGELTKVDTSKEVTLCGWIHSRRDHGGVIFIDLRDKYGFTQIVFEPSKKDIFTHAEHLSREDVVKITGMVKLRPKGMKNPKMVTGEIEVYVNYLEILSKSKTPPIEIEEKEFSEETRLKYRYLDLRRKSMQDKINFRHKVVQATRYYFDQQGFIEIETPVLMKPTPEGARDYLVPSRVHKGKFYALPQSPQIYKQLCMIAGFDKYFQVARCFRDEDLRADRQPEFTQLDIEMSFISEADIFHAIEGWTSYVFKKVLKKEIKTPFPKITYKEAVERYGTDKPDLRFGLELINLTELMQKTSINIFKNNDCTKCIFVEHDFSRKELDELEDLCKQHEAKGLAYAKFNGKKLEGGISKFLEDHQASIIKKVNAKKHGTIFFISGTKKITNDVLSRLRNELGKRLNLINKDEFNFCWITEFPLFALNGETQQWEPEHHPFTGVHPEDFKYLDSKDLSNIRSRAYDIVLNGTELGSGSIRISDPALQAKIFKMLNISDEDAKRRFGFFIEALKYGTPIHGGIALGIDRVIALMFGITDIREVIAFPKNKAAQDMMSESPSETSQDQLKELKIKFDS